MIEVVIWSAHQTTTTKPYLRKPAESVVSAFLVKPINRCPVRAANDQHKIVSAKIRLIEGSALNRSYNKLYLNIRAIRVPGQGHEPMSSPNANVLHYSVPWGPVGPQEPMFRSEADNRRPSDMNPTRKIPGLTRHRTVVHHCRSSDPQ
jgi:hypothetical protein